MSSNKGSQKKEKKWIVEYWDDENKELIKPSWIPVALEMCREGLLCNNCKKDISHLDSCDYMFMWTPIKQVALDKKEFLERENQSVRVIVK